MATYIAILRGINVSGQKKIKMTDLKAHIKSVGFQKVETYIQSGNIIFETDKKDVKEIESMIQNKIAKEYDFEVLTLVKTLKEIEYAIAHNPFANDTDKEINKIYVTFLSDIPDTQNIKKLEILAVKYSQEEYILDGKNIYFHSSNSYRISKINNNFFENKLKVSATTRNWKTVNKLAEMARKSNEAKN